MKQDELEKFVEQVAKAERDAAEQIRQAEEEFELRLANRAQQLEVEHQTTLKQLYDKFEQETKVQTDDLKAYQQLLERRTRITLEKMQTRHQAVHDQLVAWMIESVKC